MKKTLIAVALATLSATSMADVILYGQIKGGVEVTKVKGESGTTTQIVDYGSRIGFKGHEHLNGDLKAIWQLEQSVNIGGSATGFGTRNSFIGLEGGFGRVTAGHQHNFVGDFNGDLDIWEYDSELAGLGIFTRNNDVIKRRTSLRYVSPDFGGFSFGAYVSPSDNNNVNRESSVYSATVNYKAENGLFAGVFGTLVKNGANNTDPDKDGYQAVAQFGYDAAPWFAGVAYQYARNVDGAVLGSAGSITRSQEVALSASYDINEMFRVKGSAAYGFGFKTGLGASQAKAWGNGKYVQGIVGADVMLSKRTTANAQFGFLQVGHSADKSRAGTISVGMKHKF